MTMSIIELFMWISLLILGFLVFMTFIYPRYFGRPRGPEVRSPFHRPPPELIDPNIPMGRAEIVSRTAYGNGKMTLRLRNKAGTFVKDYLEDGIIPLSSSQVLADEGAPLYITREVKYSDSDFEKEMSIMMKSLEQRTVERDKAMQDIQYLKANEEVNVTNQIKNAVDLVKAGKKDFRPRSQQ